MESPPFDLGKISRICLKMVFLHQIGLNKDQKGLRMYQQGLNIIMVYGFLDNVCGDFFVIFSGVVFHAVVFRDMWSDVVVALLGFDHLVLEPLLSNRRGAF